METNKWRNCYLKEISVTTTGTWVESLVKRMMILQWGWCCQIMAIIQVDADRCFRCQMTTTALHCCCLLPAVSTMQLMKWVENKVNLIEEPFQCLTEWLKVGEDNEVSRLLPDALAFASLAPSGSSVQLQPVSVHLSVCASHLSAQFSHSAIGRPLVTPAPSAASLLLLYLLFSLIL